MSDANPTVYAYLDLAERDGSMFAVPLSDGRTHYTNEQCLDAYRLGTLTGIGVTFVRGARALEVAEREVREAVNAGAPERWARAVDLRDRLRAKLAETGTKFVTLTKSDARDRVGLGIDYASGPAKTCVVMSTLTGHAQEFRSTDVYKTVEAAQARGVCRVCGLKPEHGPGLPFMYDYGREYAHEACLAQKRKSAKPDETCVCGHARYTHRYAWLPCGVARDCDTNGCTCEAFTRKSAPETQPVFLATLRAADGRDPVNPNAPWVIQGEHGWVWRLTHVQVFKIKRDGRVEDTRCSRAILFVAQDWKPSAAPPAFISPDMRTWLDLARQDGTKRAAVSERRLREQHGKCGVCHVKPATRIVTQNDPDEPHVYEAIVCDSCNPFFKSQEAKPMPEKPKPDPHDKCRMSLRDGVLVDDYGRRIDGIIVLEGADRANGTKLDWDSVRVVARVFAPTTDAATRPASASPDPFVLKCENTLLPSEVDTLKDQFRVIGRPLIIIPHGANPVDSSEVDGIRSDISRRADLAAASKKAWRWGIAVGAVGAFALACAAFLAVDRLKPEWMAHHQHSRAPLATPWSPAVLDEHARESEDARAGGK